MNDKLKQRMQKLLAMSQDTSSPEEAMIAAKRLHALLSKHSMSMADVGDESEQIGEGSFESINFPYRRVIAHHVAKLYYCQMYYVRHRRNYAQIVLVGKEHHRQIAETIIDQVLRIVDRDAAKASMRACGRRDSTYISSFRNGAAATIAQRCLQLISEARAGNLVDDETGEKLPVLASLYDQENALVDEFLAGVELRTRKSRTRANDAMARASGAETGRRVPLHQGLANTAPKLLA